MSSIQNPGKYPATVSSAEFGESSTGTPYLRIDFNTEAGESIAGYLYLSEKALPNSVRTLRDAFEFDGNFESAVEQITGKPCSITVENEEYDGKERMKVKWINSPRSSKPIDNQESFLKSLSAKAARIPKEAPKNLPPTKPAPKAPAKAGSKVEPF